MDFSKPSDSGYMRWGITILSPKEAFALCIRSIFPDSTRASNQPMFPEMNREASRTPAIVDLREAYETNFRVFDVQDVIYLPWTRFDEESGSLPPDRPLILADASGIYARGAALSLKARGWHNVAIMAGGMIDWDADGLPVRRDAAFELGGQCACRIKTRSGGNPLKANPASRLPAGI